MSTTSTTSNTNQTRHQRNYTVTGQLQLLREEKNGIITEVGGLATWSLSSFKNGFGVEHLRDNRMDTYWQSDGPQPHLVNITFTRKMTIKHVCIYVDFTLDDDYTPCKISIRAGNSYTDLHEVELFDLDRPTGWVIISPKDGYEAPIRACHIQIAVLGNHRTGHNTHLRQVKIYCPVNNDVPNSFSTLSLRQHTNLR